jgi:hypothetical protein
MESWRHVRSVPWKTNQRVMMDFISNNCKQIPVFERCTAHGGLGETVNAELDPFWDAK